MTDLQTSLSTELREIFSFGEVESVEVIQDLWSGYGTLARVHVSQYEAPSIIVKRIAPPEQATHPRGWHSDVGHQRKLRSYDVEANWYQDFNARTSDACRTPRLIGFKRYESNSILVLEDLNQSGYYLRKHTLSQDEIKSCLSWLATFHATFMNEAPTGLWEIGTYWQLETRQDELEAMSDGKLKDKASSIHQTLCDAQYQTLVHGDAKYANFCFAPDGRVAAVDFQYVGRGCGMKDVAYLLSCIEGGIANDQEEEAFLSHYFSVLGEQLKLRHSGIPFNKLEHEWRQLYPFAWADFERFLAGWAPGHWKSTEFARRQVQRTLIALEQSND